jgi:K+-transporting ATPase KdpF subunit
MRTVMIDLPVQRIIVPFSRLKSCYSLHDFSLPGSSASLSKPMIILYLLMGVLALFLFIYLLAALLKPELFP